MSSAATSPDVDTTIAAERSAPAAASNGSRTVTEPAGVQASARSGTGGTGRIDPAELRTVTPEVIQILAATGC